MEKNTSGLQSISKRGGRGGVDKRYWPRIVRFPYSLGRVQSTIANRDSKKTVLNGEEVKDFQRKIGRD